MRMMGKEGMMMRRSERGGRRVMRGGVCCQGYKKDKPKDRAETQVMVR